MFILLSVQVIIARAMAWSSRWWAVQTHRYSWMCFCPRQWLYRRQCLVWRCIGNGKTGLKDTVWGAVKHLGMFSGDRSPATAIMYSIRVIVWSWSNSLISCLRPRESHQCGRAMGHALGRWAVSWNRWFYTPITGRTRWFSNKHYFRHLLYVAQYRPRRGFYFLMAQTVYRMTKY